MEGYTNVSGNHEDFDDLNIESRDTLDGDDTKEKNELEVQRLRNIKVKLDDGGFGYVFSIKTTDHSERWRCHLCDVVVISQKHVETHIQTKKHQLKLTLPSHPPELFARVENKKSAVEIPQLAPGEPVPPGFEDVVKRVTQIQATLDSHISSPLIGLEYLVELAPDERGKEPMYICMLCDKKGDPRVVMAHLTSYNHRAKYIGIYYPTANKALFNEFPRTKEGKKGMLEIVTRICTKIEDKYGRLQPLVVEKEIFDTRKDQIIKQITEEQHFRETPDETFVELVDLKVLEELAAQEEEPEVEIIPTAENRSTFNKGKISCDRSRLRARDEDDNIEEESKLKHSTKGSREPIEESNEAVPEEEEGSVDVLQIQDILDEHDSSPIIGLEYLVEIRAEIYGREPSYMCMLCDKRADPRVILIHLTSDKHYIKYFGMYYPTAHRKMIDEFPKTKEGKKGVIETVIRICGKIEEKYGRLKPLIVTHGLFSSHKDYIVKQITESQHFRETPDETFVELIDVKILDELAAEEAQKEGIPDPITIPIVEKKKSKVKDVPTPNLNISNFPNIHAREHYDTIQTHMTYGPPGFINQKKKKEKNRLPQPVRVQSENLRIIDFSNFNVRPPVLPGFMHPNRSFMGPPIRGLGVNHLPSFHPHGHLRNIQPPVPSMLPNSNSMAFTGGISDNQRRMITYDEDVYVGEGPKNPELQSYDLSRAHSSSRRSLSPQPRSRSRSRSGSYSRSRYGYNRRSQSRSRSRSGSRGRQLSPSKYLPRRSRSVSPVLRQGRKESPRGSPSRIHTMEQYSKWEEFHQEFSKIEEDITMNFKFHKRNPETHAMYSEEWRTFWNRRYRELKTYGKDPSQHDFMHEWIDFWNKRLDEMCENEIKNKKEELKLKMGLFGEDPQAAHRKRLIQETDTGREHSWKVLTDNIIKGIAKVSQSLQKKQDYHQGSPSRTLQRESPSREKDYRDEIRGRKKQDYHEGSPSRTLQRESPSREKDYRDEIRGRKKQDYHEGSPSRKLHRGSPSREKDYRDEIRGRKKQDYHKGSPSRKLHRVSPSKEKDHRDQIRGRKEQNYHQRSPSRKVQRGESSSRERDRMDRIPGRKEKDFYRGSPSRKLQRRRSSSREKDHRDQIRGTKEQDYHQSSPNRKLKRVRSSSREKDRSNQISRMKEQNYHQSSPSRKLQREDSSSRGNDRRDYRDDICNKEPKSSEVVTTLRLLTALESQLGSLGPRVNSLLSTALSMDKICPNSSDDLLSNSDNVVLLDTVKEKLRGQLLAGILEGNMVRATKSCIQKLEELSAKAEISGTPSLSTPVIAPNIHSGIGNLDKVAIAQHISALLIAQGKTDVSHSELEQLINTVIGMAQVSGGPENPVSSASLMSQLHQLLISTLLSKRRE